MIPIALGIGANTAIFTVVNAVLLRPLGYGHPQQLVVLEHKMTETTVPAEVLRWRADSLRAFAGIGAANVGAVTLTGRGDPEQLNAMNLTASLLPLLEVAPLFGRVFAPEEAHDGRNTVAILSYDFWRRRLGGDRGVLGQTLILDGVPRTIIGVMPRDFHFAPYWATRPDLWLPLSLDGRENDWETASLRTFARLRPGVTPAQAQVEMTAVGARTRQSAPDADERIVVVPLHEKVTGPVKTELWLLVAVVGLVLLIACANVMHLQLMRAAARARESAVRLSLGAARGRLIQQSLTESLLLSLIGAAIGLGFAWFGVEVLVALAPIYIPRIESVHFDAAVFGFMLSVGVATGVISGVVPALAAARIDPNQMLRAGGRGASASGEQRRLGAFLVISEFAMAVVLLIGAALVLRSFAAMMAVDPGFDPHDVSTMQVAMRGVKDDDPARRNPFFTALTERIKAVPGVEAVGAINHLPLHGDSWGFSLWTEAQPLATRDEQPHAYFRLIRPGYFATMRVPLLRGRDITMSDVINRAHVVVIDEAMARANWPNADPVGRRISVDEPAKGADWFTVIGVVKNVQQAGWSYGRQGEMYYPYWRGAAPDSVMRFSNLLSPNTMTFVIRGRGTVIAMSAAVRKAVSELDPDAAAADVISMQQALNEQVAEPTFYLVLLGGFAIVALVLAAIGVYGVLGFVVASRTREIGIRLALGAPGDAPFRLAIGQGLRLALVGTACGIAGALALTRYLRVLLYGIGPTDLATFAIVPVVLIIVAMLACYVPACRAARVDPMVALRGE